MFDEDDKKYFFGIYETDPTKFEFKDGDVNLILEVVDYVKQQLNDVGIGYFKTNIRRKVSFQNVCQLSLGKFFARKETGQVVVSNSGVRSMNEEQMKERLFNDKLKPLIESLPETVEQFHGVSPDIIKIVNEGNTIFADILCVFCPNDAPDNSHRIQCNPSQRNNICYWNPSNYKKHIKWHNKKNTEEADVDLNEINAENDDERDERPPAKKAKGVVDKNKKQKEIKKEFPAKVIKNATKGACKGSDFDSNQTIDSSNLLLDQMSKQNLFNMKNTLENGEKHEMMSFTLNSDVRSVKIGRIMPNGSCFFGTVAHQIYGCKINSDEHKQKTADLRAEAVNYIKLNFERFQFDLQSRVYDVSERTKEQIKKEELEKECRFYMNFCLPKETCHAGSESIRAISQLKEMNIITIGEQGESHLAVDFNDSYTRSIFLAHRLAASVSTDSNTNIHNSDRDHYDSVFEINTDILYTMAEHLNAEAIRRKAINNQNNNNITLE